MKYTINTVKVTDDKVRYYQPDESLVKWIERRLEIEKQRSSFEKTKSAGEKLPNSFYKKLNESGARKTQILDDVVFQSMANLIYFFD